MNVTIFLKNPNGTEIPFTKILRLFIEKEAYTPYARISAEIADTSGEMGSDYTKIMVVYNNFVLFNGIPDRLVLIKGKNGAADRLLITGRSHVSMLMDNQLEPGLYTRQSLNSFMDTYININPITHEDNNIQDYIYVKKGSSMWDAITTLSYKITGRYPYIYGSNKVMMNHPPSPKRIVLSDVTVLEKGEELYLEKAQSHYHIEDIDGTYGLFDYVEQELIDRGIIRHHYYEFDRRFLSAPEKAGTFRDLMAMRGFKRKYAVIDGVIVADVNDIMVSETGEERRIKRMRLTGTSEGIWTELSIYDDRQPS